MEKSLSLFMTMLNVGCSVTKMLNRKFEFYIHVFKIFIVPET